MPATRGTRRNHRILLAGYRRGMATGQARQHVLLERAEELAALDAVIADTLAGLGRFAVVEGSAGIGKSSLLAEARLRASEAGMAVVTARGTEIERSFSYGAVRQLFERLVAQSDEAERRDYWRARPPMPANNVPRRPRFELLERPPPGTHVKLVDGMWTERPMSTRPNAITKPLETARKPSVGLEPTTPSLPWKCSTS